MSGFHHLNRAIAIAAEAHTNQLDKAGQPYILHPLRVMGAMKYEDARIVAVLHDLLEDCPEWTLDRLRGEGFDGGQLRAIDLLTRRPGVAYMDYIAGIAPSGVAVEVKRADLRDNMDLNRFTPTSDADWARYTKYAKALSYLS